MSVSNFNNSEIRDFLDEKKDALLKRKFFYDTEGNVTDIYIAQSSAVSGEKCLRDKFTYISVSGIGYVVDKEEWFSASWDPNWDM